MSSAADYMLIWSKAQIGQIDHGFANDTSQFQFYFERNIAEFLLVWSLKCASCGV